ncbi:MAG: prepilin peptidase [Clostridia bacterium]|nr:prepilin peptidase [Clostridia bacterium]
MNLYFYILIFIIGTLFGSFYTLAVHRIPKRQDIVHTHSYCPNCNHKLGFLDLIPIFSYVVLWGKCRYCKEKIRPRYLILEILSGIAFVTLAILMDFHFETLNIVKIMQYSFVVLYVTFIILMSGIDKENRRIDKLVSVYGIVISIMYMLYLCIVEQANIYRYGIYLFFYIMVLLLDTITLKRYAKNSYVTGILLSIITMVIFTGEYVTENAIIFTLLAIFFYMLMFKIKERKKKVKKSEEQIANRLSIGFFLGSFNIMMLTLVLYFTR